MAEQLGIANPEKLQNRGTVIAAIMGEKPSLKTLKKAAAPPQPQNAPFVTAPPPPTPVARLRARKQAESRVFRSLSCQLLVKVQRRYNLCHKKPKMRNKQSVLCVRPRDHIFRCF